MNVRRSGVSIISICAVFIAVGAGCSQQPAAVSLANTSSIGKDGTAYITRVVPVPKTISAEAQAMLAAGASDRPGRPHTVQEDRASVDQWQRSTGDLAKKMYPVVETTSTLAGVPVRIIAPLIIEPALRNRVLLNLHGGGFHVDSGSRTETIPLANLTGMKVISVLYRLAPEHPFPAGAEDAIVVYGELLKTYSPDHIAIYGTSAGAILTAEVSVLLKQRHIPLPAATGFFSGTGDLSQGGDSVALFSGNGLSGHLDPPAAIDPALADYIGSTDPRDPVLSPYYADLRDLPPTLFITSGRDRRLSGTTILHRAYLRAGNAAELIVFEALPHAFWNNPLLPESREADLIMANFFKSKLGK